MFADENFLPERVHASGRFYTICEILCPPPRPGKFNSVTAPVLTFHGMVKEINGFLRGVWLQAQETDSNQSKLYWKYSSVFPGAHRQIV